MGFLSKVFGGSTPKREVSRLEQYVDALNPGVMHRKIKETAESLKTPTAQALTVFGFSGIVVNGMREFAEEMPEPFRTSQAFPYDLIFAEVAAFFYFYCVRECLDELDADEGEDDDLGDQGDTPNPYFDSLKMSMLVGGRLIHSLSGKVISEAFIKGRATTFVSIDDSANKDVYEALAGFIMQAWYPDQKQALLELSAPALSIQSSIGRMPLDSAREACRQLFDEKVRNPKAY